MLRITHYRTWGELEELSDHWNPLLAKSSSDTIFLTWQWCAAWWKNYGAALSLFVLAAWEGNDLLGIAPLCIRRTRRNGREWQVLRFVGDGSHDSDYLDCFMAPGRELEVTAAFAHYLESERKSWDWLEWNGSPESSRPAVLFAKCVREKNWGVNTEIIRCASLSLPSDWNAYLCSLEPRFRTQVRSSLTMLKDHLHSEPLSCSSSREIAEWLPVLFDLHTKRWATKGEAGVFGNPAKQAFYCDVARLALEKGWLSFHRLNWGERPLALQFGFKYRNRFYLLQEGYDPDYAAIRPGIALRAWSIRHYIDSRLDEYDFLAGVSSYKLRWAAEEKIASRMLMAPDRKSQFVAVDWPRSTASAKQAIAAVIPSPVVRWRRKLRAAAGLRRHSNVVPPQPESKWQHPGKYLAAAVYSHTPLARVGKSLASTYTWNRNSKWVPLKRREKPVFHIFQYHRVNDDRDPFLYGLPVSTFRAHMRYLTANFPLLTLDQIATGEFSDRHPYYVAVTFDDGYRDNFVCAFPILKELGIPASIFLVSGHIESGQMPWYDLVRLAFKLTTRASFSLEHAGGPSGAFKSALDRLCGMENTLLWLRRMREPDRRAAIPRLFGELGVPSDLSLPNQMLRWDDIRQMSKQGISFGAHTVTHPVLSNVSVAQLREEISESKRAIEQRLQRPVLHFAYPFGHYPDFGPQAKQFVRTAGYKTAVTAEWGVNEPGSDLFELRRFTPWDSDAAEFRLKLDWYRLRELRVAGREIK